MSNKKIPFSLRGGVMPAATSQPTVAKAGQVPTLGVLAAALVATATPYDGAQAQASGQLPALNVEAPAEVRRTQPARARPAQARPANRSAARPRAARPAQAAAPGGPAPVVAAPGANPYADPAAPYKVDRSANTKLTEPLLNQPRTITTIPKEVIADKGATSFRELMRTTPGLTLGTGEGGNAYGDRVYIRGFDARNDVYVDGVRDAGVNIRETFNTEQVEISKGPSGTIGGRGSSGGAINVVTKVPSFVNFTKVELTGGTDATRRATLDANYVVNPDLAVRVNAMGQLADVAGRDEVFDNRWGGALAVTYKPLETFKVTLSYSHTDIDQMPDWGVPFNTTTLRPYTENGLRRSNFYGLPNRDFQKATQDIASVKAEWDVTPWLNITNTTRYGFSVLDYVAGAPGTPVRTAANPELWTVPSTAKSRYQEVETYANQTNATFKFDTFGWKHTLVTGVEVSREDLSRDSYQALTTEAFGVTNIAGNTLNLWNPRGVDIPWTGSFVKTGRPTTVRVDTASLYALDTINIQDKLILTGGIRVEHYDTSATSIAATNVATTLSRDDTLVNYNLGATYKLLPELAIYAAYGTSSNPSGAELDGNGNDYGGLTAQNATLGPEKNKSYEAGVKWEAFDRKLLLTGAVFRTEKTNARETLGANLVAGGEYHIDGVEFSAGGKVFDRLSLFGGAVFMQSEVDKSVTAANIGRKLANVAHQSFNLLAKYDVTDKLTVGAQATFFGKQYGGTLAANNNVLPDKWRFDALAEYKFTPTISAKLQVINITNEVIYDGFYRSGSPYVYLAPGRSATFTLAFKY
jgi:catecholate siderophore receptor